MQSSVPLACSLTSAHDSAVQTSSKSGRISVAQVPAVAPLGWKDAAIAAASLSKAWLLNWIVAGKFQTSLNTVPLRSAFTCWNPAKWVFAMISDWEGPAPLVTAAESAKVIPNITRRLVRRFIRR